MAADASLKVSIVSPSFNQWNFVRRTLDSVAWQDCAGIEHIIQDACSGPETRTIIDAYVGRNHRAKVYYEKDAGQSDAIVRGFRKSTGDILTWLNTDDAYIDSDVVSTVAGIFATEPQTDVVYGRGNFVDASGRVLREAYIQTDAERLRETFVNSVGILQPALFFRRRLVEGDEPIDLSMACAFDYELWLRMLAKGARFRFLDRMLVDATFHTDAKSSALRARQLGESAEVVKRYYGFASAEWLDRLAEYEILRRNGIVDESGVDGASPLVGQLAGQHFRRSNASNKALGSLLAAPRTAAFRASHAAAERLNFTELGGVVVTTFDDHYLSQGVTMIASVREQMGGQVPVLVYDLNLSAESRARIASLYNVHLVAYPQDAVAAYPDFLHPKSYGYKCVAFNNAKRFVGTGGLLLWIDAGVAAVHSLKPLFDLIARDDVFFVDHNDKPSWPFYNGTFTHPRAIEKLEATVPELFGEHLCSCLMGYRKGGRFEGLFEEAARCAQDREIVVWDKHPTADEPPGQVPTRTPDVGRARRLASDERSLATLTHEKAASILGFLGHRQDQSILSILACRHKAPIQSAKRYCRSDEPSSLASKLNWNSGAASDEIEAATTIPPNLRSAVTYHHRGTYLSTYVPEAAKSETSTLVLLGNGPSLRGFDLKRFSAFDTMGMNAAYRHWDGIGWYPTYYICLDKVVGLSHASEIARLIRERDRNGIRAFILRTNVIAELPGDLRRLDIVLDFDAYKAAIPWFEAMPITTGSHSALFGALFGYKRILLAGIDVNYVERVEGSAVREGTVLEIVAQPEQNPNYFFEGYQAVGDKYNVPNSSPDLHLESWRAVAPALKARGIAVWNLSAISRVDAFAKRTLEDVLGEPEPGGPTPMPILLPDGGPSGFPRDAHAHVEEVGTVADLLRDRRGPSHVMLDIGAHFGTSAAYFDRLGWRIHCYEPDPGNREKLTQRFGRSRNVTIDPRAVGDAPAEGVAFFASTESTGISGLHAFRDTHRQNGTVDVTTVAEIATERGLTSVDFLKIDVEGFDFAVLKGVPWDRLRPDVIVCEFEDAKTVSMGHRWQDIGEFLAGKGYAVYVSEWHAIVRYGAPHDWRRLVRYPGAGVALDAWGNLLAFRDDPGYPVLAALFDKAATRAPDATRRPAAAPASPVRPLTHPAFPPIEDRAPMATGGRFPGDPPRPFYADFGDWLRPRAPRTFRALQQTRRSFANVLPGEKKSPWQAALEKELRQFHARLDGLERSTHELSDLRKALEQLHARLNGTEGSTRARLEEERTQLHARLDGLERSTHELSDLRKALEQLHARLDGLEGSTRELPDLRKTLEEATAEIAGLRESVQQAQAATASVEQALARQGAGLDRSNYSNAATFRVHRRRLADEDLQHLRKKWLPLLGLKVSDIQLRYLAHRICLEEERCEGRLATTIQAAMLRALALMSLQPQRLEVLEIGSLFGISAGTLHRVAGRVGKTAQLTLIDPLHGYYDISAQDASTGVLVSRAVLEENLAALSVPAADYQVIQHLSTAPEALEATSDRSYDLILVDGDHSLKGVSTDFSLYGPRNSRGRAADLRRLRHR